MSEKPQTEKEFNIEDYRLPEGYIQSLTQNDEPQLRASHRFARSRPTAALRRERERRALENNELRDRSGAVASHDPLVSVFYELLRDHLPAGVLESVVVGVQIEDPEIVYSNGFLANYAKDLADRIRAMTPS